MSDQREFSEIDNSSLYFIVPGLGYSTLFCGSMQPIALGQSPDSNSELMLTGALIGYVAYRGVYDVIHRAGEVLNERKERQASIESLTGE
ncbi:hypothetical protein ACFL0V_02275 [Nanoarchaeota archaeon]